jgi:hypothetical protein
MAASAAHLVLSVGAPVGRMNRAAADHSPIPPLLPRPYGRGDQKAHALASVRFGRHGTRPVHESSGLAPTGGLGICAVRSHARRRKDGEVSASLPSRRCNRRCSALGSNRGITSGAPRTGRPAGSAYPRAGRNPAFQDRARGRRGSWERPAQFPPDWLRSSVQSWDSRAA